MRVTMLVKMMSSNSVEAIILLQETARTAVQTRLVSVRFHFETCGETGLWVVRRLPAKTTFTLAVCRVQFMTMTLALITQLDSEWN